MIDKLFNIENLKQIKIFEKEKEFFYQDVKNKIISLQQYFTLKKRESIAVILPNGVDYVASFFSIVFSGNIVFPINPDFKSQEIIPLLIKTKVKKIITSFLYVEKFEYIQKLLPNLLIVYVEKLQINCSKKDIKICNKNEDDIILLLSTSGTTSNPKIVKLSEKNLKTSVIGYLDKMNFKVDEMDFMRYIPAIPLFSSYGIMIMLACIVQNFALVFLDSTFSFDELLKAVEVYQVTNIECSATILQIFEKLCKKKIKYDISTLIDIGVGGSKLFGQTLINIEKEYPKIRIRQGYGMTEASPLITKHERLGNVNYDSVGKAIKDVEVLINASNKKITTMPNIIGEIIVKGKNIMSGYYKNNKETKKIIKHGYLYTGDIGYIDKDGFIFIVGRKKNVIINCGFNVYPEEIEAVVMQSGLVENCCVYSNTNLLEDENICIDAVPKNQVITKQQIQEYCRQNLAHYKIPHKINFIDSLEMTSTGKVKRDR